MSKQKLLYILLVLGLVAVGVGIWLVIGYGNENAPEDLSITVNIPEGEPVVYERVSFTMAGENRELYIYPDGSIVYIEEKGLRLKMPANPPARTWKMGELMDERLTDLLTCFENSGMDELQDSYTYLGTPVEGGGFGTSDMRLEIIVITDNLSKKVKAFGYLSPDNGGTYPDMPSPLDEIYVKLRAVALETVEVYREDISD